MQRVDVTQSARNLDFRLGSGSGWMLGISATPPWRKNGALGRRCCQAEPADQGFPWSRTTNQAPTELQIRRWNATFSRN